jgi:hypothetical protein
MNTRCMPFMAALAMAASPAAVLAQATAPAAAASAAQPAAAAKPGPRRALPPVRRDAGFERQDLRPEHPVIPQIKIPLGRAEPAPLPPKPKSQRAGLGGAAATTGIDDAVARCEARTDARERTACRDALARDKRSGTP